MGDRRFSNPPEDLRTNARFNSVKRFNLLQILEVFVGCTTASRKLYKSVGKTHRK